MSRSDRRFAGVLPAVLGHIRFDEPLESAFRARFDQQGRESRLQLWITLALFMSAALIFHRALLKLPPEVLPLGRQLIFGVMVPVVLRWLSSAWSPLHRWSAALYIGSVFIDIACLMLLRVACLRAGYDAVPLIMPVALLMSLIVVQIRFLLLVPMILLGLVGIAGVELWAFEADSNRLFQIAAASIMLLVALSPAYELERWARIGWLRERRLNEMASTDALTGLANRRQFDTALRQLIRMAARERKNVTLALIDIDHFKSYNDHYGHPAGDDCLRRIGHYLSGSMRRPHDFAARLGGEEFAVVWFDARPEAAMRLAEQLRLGISALGIAPAPGRGDAVTASAGLIQVQAPRPEAAADDVAVEMMRKADAPLYEAKRSGRNRLVVSDAPIEAAMRPSAARYPAPVIAPEALPSAAPNPNPNPAASSSRLSGALAQIRLAEPQETDFRASYERQGRSSRAQILIGLLITVVFLLVFQDSLLKIPEEADRLGRLTLSLGLVPAALVGLLGCFIPRLYRWSALLYIGAIGVILSAQMFERIIQLPLGYDVVPLMMPVAVLLSLSVVQIRYSLLVPAMLLNLAGVVAAELWAFEASSNRLLETGTAIFMVVVTLIFSYKLERSARIGWQRERHLDELASTDGLTGLANRHHFDAALRQDIRAAQREGRNVALMILDVDHFKSYNDHYGHPAGDACLAAIGHLLGTRMRRARDYAARLGGEEFAAVWFDASAEDAPRLAEELRRSVSTLGIVPAPGHGETVTASAGFVQIIRPTTETTADSIAADMMRTVDAALYRAKRSGRDRFVVAGGLSGL